MSVINRMLTDLERRGGNNAAGAPDLQPAPPARRPRTSARAWGRIGLALALLAIASVLWVQRGPAVAEQVRYVLGEPASTEPAPIAEVDPVAATEAGSNESAQLTAAADPLQAELTGLRFVTGDAGEVMLVLAFAGEPPPLALPALDDGALDLWLSARGHDVAVPAPPAGQDLFRGLSLAAGDRATRLRIDLATDARVAFEHGDRASIRLAARRPTPAAPEDGGRAAPAATAAASDPDTADGSEAGTVATRESSAEGGEPAGVSANGVAAATTPGTAAAELRTIEVAADTSVDVRADDDTSPQVRARRRYTEARDALADGELRRARRLLEQAVELDGSMHSAREVLVALLLRAGDTTTARNVLADGIARAPARPAFARPYARLLIEAGRPEAASAALEAARINAAGGLEFHSLLANAYRRADNHRAAMAEYTEALEIDSTQSSLWLGLGISLAAEGHADEAVEAFAEARATGQLSDSLDRWAQQRIDALADGRGER